MSNRQIKFRAWDGSDMLYSHNNIINHSYSQLHWFFDRIADNFELMQFTGLKDKNGVDIYEGDITDKGLVVFHQDYLGFFVKLPNLSYNPLYDSGSLKVIGNLHQNPELL